MSNGIVAKRYAVALFQLAKEKQTLDQIEAELRVVKQVFTSNAKLTELLSNPKVSVEKKKGLVKDAFAAFSEQVLNTLYLLLDRHRETIVAELVDEFIDLANEERGIAEAKVYTVRPLTDVEQANISTQFARKVGKVSLRIENIVDRTLIGGVKIRIGNRIYDGSVSGKLQRLERELVAKRS
jgi:F-type H+-transporting ATPase subunit delta